jgi:hypothetical protein
MGFSYGFELFDNDDISNVMLKNYIDDGKYPYINEDYDGSVRDLFELLLSELHGATDSGKFARPLNETAFNLDEWVRPICSLA